MIVAICTIRYQTNTIVADWSGEERQGQESSGNVFRRLAKADESANLIHLCKNKNMIFAILNNEQVVISGYPPTVHVFFDIESVHYPVISLRKPCARQDGASWSDYCLRKRRNDSHTPWLCVVYKGE